MRLKNEFQVRKETKRITRNMMKEDSRRKSGE